MQEALSYLCVDHSSAYHSSEGNLETKDEPSVKKEATSRPKSLTAPFTLSIAQSADETGLRMYWLKEATVSWR
ncbi:hypothetical protein HYQ46_002609 [Verticillium longisporum]|nr:hypothetical protein HYQ46_002609 [Verticillium longisporum]